ncbi:hypothetical protein EZS27_042459, partial [termite gut metagenome]
MYYSFSLLIVCFSFNTAKFNSMVVSVPEVFISSSSKADIISPLFCINDFCLSSLVVLDSSTIVRDSSLILANVSTIARVVCVVFALFILNRYHNIFLIHLNRVIFLTVSKFKDNLFNSAIKCVSTSHK